MHYNKGKQMTLGDLRKYTKELPDDTNLFVGFGEQIKPLHYLGMREGGLMFHPDIYGEDAKCYNWNTIINLLLDRK